MMLNYPVSVIIPMYNEALNVIPLLSEIQQSLQDFPKYQIVVVDDGSSDDTLQQLLICKTKMPELTIVRHKRNFGQSAGMITGIGHAQYPWIITLDGDGQNDPADIPKLFAALDSEKPTKPILIVGNRKKRNDNWLRRLSSKVANTVRGKLLRDDCPDTGCGLKLFEKEVFMRLPHFNHVHRFLPALYKRAGGNIINVSVNHRPRVRGQSKYGVMNRLWVGIVDIVGVVWLIRRPCNPEVEQCQ